MNCLTCSIPLPVGAVCPACQAKADADTAQALADLIRLAVSLDIYPGQESAALAMASDIEAGQPAELEVAG
jgi:hypothetical protein